MTGQIPSSRASHPSISSLSRRSLDLLSLLWRVFAAPEALLLMLGLAAMALMLATLIPQIPPQAMDDPEAWLAVQSGFLARNSDLVRTLGLVDVFHSFWFRLLLAVTGLTLFVWLVESAGLAWSATARLVGGRGHWSPSAFAHWGKDALQHYASSARSVPETLIQARESLSEQGYKCYDVLELPAPNMVASRRALCLWAEPMVYGGILTALFGMIIAGSWGWGTQDRQLAPGESLAVGHDTRYRIRLDAFDLRQDQDGQLLDCRSEITWLEDGVEVGRAEAGIGRPAAFRGIVARQVGYVPVVSMRGLDSTGRPLALKVGGEELSIKENVEITFPTPTAQQLIVIAGHELYLALSLESLSTQSTPALHLAVLGDDATEPQSLAVLRRSGTVEVEGLQLELDVDYRPLLRVDYRPGMGLVLAGLAVAVIGLAAGWLLSPRLLWIALGTDKQGRTLVQVLTLPAARGGRWPERLTSRLQETLADDG